MTNETVKVEQIDRDAAARFQPDGRERDQILRGKRDKTAAVQSYAAYRHRLAALATPARDEVGLSDGDRGFLRDLAARIFKHAAPAIGFDQGDVDRLYRIASLTQCATVEAGVIEGFRPINQIAMVIENAMMMRGRLGYSDKAMIAAKKIVAWFDDPGCLNCSVDDPPATVEADHREGCAGPMTAERACYFLERFKREERMLGPHEQWALDFALATLRAPPATLASDEVEVASRAMMSVVFQLLPPDRGDVFSWLNDHAAEIAAHITKALTSRRDEVEVLLSDAQSSIHVAYCDPNDSDYGHCELCIRLTEAAAIRAKAGEVRS